MEEAVAPLKDSNYYINWMHSLDTTWRGVSTGAIVTLVIQSSSATVGMVIGLASQNLISFGARKDCFYNDQNIFWLSKKDRNFYLHFSVNTGPVQSNPSL